MIARLCANRDRVTCRHLGILLVLTCLIQGVMFLSYPLPSANFDDNQAAQSYLIGELLSGNVLVGNVRYNTGYAFVMAPARALTQTLGRLDDRAFLLAQLLAYSAIPFMVYDMLRRRYDRRTAFIAALVVLVDPFAWQWAHFQLPEWLIALAIVLALWLAQLAWSAPLRRRMALLALAAVGFGLMTFARLNFLPLAALYSFSFLLWRHIPWRQRIAQLALTGAISFGILGAYIVLIQIPSTGGGRLSCTSGTTLLAAVRLKDLPLRASNGPHSARYADLLTLEDIEAATVKPGQYRHWRMPGPWVSEAAQAAFFAQPFGEASEEIGIVFPSTLFTYMGPCPLDTLLTHVALEAIAKQPGQYILESLKTIFNMLILHPTELAFPAQYLESPAEIRFLGEGGLGFQRAESDFYDGHRVWKPGIVLYSTLFPWLNTIKLLTPLAALAACLRRDWLSLTAASLLLLGLLAIAAAAIAEPRYFAMAAPLGAMLIGLLLADIFAWLGRARQSNRPGKAEARNSP